MTDALYRGTIIIDGNTEELEALDDDIRNNVHIVFQYKIVDDEEEEGARDWKVTGIDFGKGNVDIEEMSDSEAWGTMSKQYKECCPKLQQVFPMDLLGDIILQRLEIISKEM